MKVTCNAKELLYALGNTVQSKRPPILQCAYLDTKDGVLRIRSTDLDTEIRVEMPATIHEHGNAICPVKEMIGLLKGLKGDVSVSTFGKNTLIVESSNGAFELEILDAADYPIASIGDDCEHLFTMPRKQLVGLMNTVGILAAGKTEPRRVLKAVNIASDNGNIAFAATNGWHLHHAIVKPQVLSKEFSVNVYPSTLKSLKGLTGETVHCWLRTPGKEMPASMLYFSTNKDEVISIRICDAHYPDYESFLPDFSNVIYGTEVNPKDLISACAKIGIPDVPIAFDMASNSKLLSISTRKGKVDILMDAACSKQGFAAKYAVNSIESVAKSLMAIGLSSVAMSFVEIADSTHIVIKEQSQGVDRFYFIIDVKGK